MSDQQIHHQQDQQLFYMAFDDGQRAYVKYRLSGAESAVRQVDFWTTFVPESQRGEGLAADLVEHCFDWADSQGLFITASCWYAAEQLQKRQQTR